MSKRNKIIVAIIGVTIVLLALLGITYAYYLTRIEGNTNTNSISITTADLKLVYGDGNGEIIVQDVMPGTTITKTFTVTNDGNSKVTGYVVIIEGLVNDLDRKDDLVYTLSCKLNDGTSCGSTVEQIYPSGTSIAAIFANDIEVDVVHNYTLTVTYKNLTDVDQSDDMGSTIKGKINIVDARTINPYDTGVTSTNNTSLTYNIINNAKTKLNGTELTGTPKTTPAKEISAEDEKVLSVTSDYMGASYYFRGSVQDNYVLFNNMCFRIVRIEGDGSTKLIYAGDVSEGATDCTEVGTDTGMIMGNYIEYGYDYTVELAHPEYKNYEGGLKDTLETWYTTKFITETLQNKIKEDKWCLGGSLSHVYDITDGSVITDINNYEVWGYEAWYRSEKLKTTSLMCQNEDYVESKYGTLTADEIKLAGATSSVNQSYYLYDNLQSEGYWTLSYYMSDIQSGYQDVSVFYADYDGSVISASATLDDIVARPSITLIPGTTIVSGGTGTIDNPYVIS